jgi:hypothetical protein
MSIRDLKKLERIIENDGDRIHDKLIEMKDIIDQMIELFEESYPDCDEALRLENLLPEVYSDIYNLREKMTTHAYDQWRGQE